MFCHCVSGIRCEHISQKISKVFLSQLYFYHLHCCYFTETKSNFLPNIVALYELLKDLISCSYNAVAFSATEPNLSTCAISAESLY